MADPRLEPSSQSFRPSTEEQDSKCGSPEMHGPAESQPPQSRDKLDQSPTRMGLPHGIKLDSGTTQRLVLCVRDNAGTDADTFNIIGYGFDRFE